MGEHSNGPHVPAVVESLVKQLYITAKAVNLYPATSSIPRERAAALRTVMVAAQRRLAVLQVRFTSSGIYWEDSTVFSGRDAYIVFARDFRAHGIVQVRFHVGATEQELIDFVGLLIADPVEVARTGGSESWLRDLGVVSITVTDPEDRTAAGSGSIEGAVAAAGAGSTRTEPSRTASPEGERTFQSALDALAEETDPTARRLLIRSLSEDACDHVRALSQRLADARWYVVRDIVTVLGTVHDAAALPALQKAARYPDPRVRREAIRALGKSADDHAWRSVAAALHDADSANVQLAARLLGAKRYVPAIAELQSVALGEGAGSRGVGARAEAIEALGRLGSPESLPVLRSLRRFRGPRSLRRHRELAPLADRAIKEITKGETARSAGEGPWGR